MDWKTLAVFLGALISAMVLWWRIYLHYISRGRAKLSAVFLVLGCNGEVPAEPQRMLNLTVTNVGNELINIVNFGVALKKGIFEKEILYPNYSGPGPEEPFPADITPKHSLFLECLMGRSYGKFAYCFMVDSTGNKSKLIKRKIETQFVTEINRRGPGIFWLT